MWAEEPPDSRSAWFWEGRDSLSVSSGLLDHGASLRAEQHGGEGAQHLSLQEKDSWDSSSSGGAGSLSTSPHRVTQPSPLPGPEPPLTLT